VLLDQLWGPLAHANGSQLVPNREAAGRVE
jgi:hypothetical protein